MMDVRDIVQHTTFYIHITLLFMVLSWQGQNKKEMWATTTTTQPSAICMTGQRRRHSVVMFVVHMWTRTTTCLLWIAYIRMRLISYHIVACSFIERRKFLLRCKFCRTKRCLNNKIGKQMFALKIGGREKLSYSMNTRRWQQQKQCKNKYKWETHINTNNGFRIRIEDTFVIAIAIRAFIQNGTWLDEYLQSCTLFCLILSINMFLSKWQNPLDR